MMADVLSKAADKPALAAQVPDVAGRLQANARALVDLVGDVLDLARFESAQGELQTVELGLDDLLRQEVALVRPLAQAKGLELKTEVSDNGLRLRTDRTKLLRIIANLLGNAIKFTVAGGVTVTAGRKPDGSVAITVSDTGAGIAPEQLEHIFDEFVRLRNPQSAAIEGHGLGLAICRRLVKALGGQISVESRLGEGSRFTVRLPASCVVEPRRNALPPLRPEPAGSQDLNGADIAPHDLKQGPAHD